MVEVKKVAGLIPITQAGNSALNYIKGRQSGEIKPFMTPWNSFNDVLMGGIEMKKIIGVAAGSGVGKSAFANQLIRGLVDLNKDTVFDIIVFNNELPSQQEVIRMIIADLGISLKELLSYKETLASEKISEIEEYISGKLSNYNIYYVEVPRTSTQYKTIIRNFYAERGNPIIVVNDHIGIGKKESDETVLEFLENYCMAQLELKKELPITQINLSQLNRDIESVERRQKNSFLNFPMRSDVRGGMF